VVLTAIQTWCIVAYKRGKRGERRDE